MWRVEYSKEAWRDLEKLDKHIIEIVLAGIEKVKQNPLPQSEGGYGKPLGHKGRQNLTGFFKIKYRNTGLRVVYNLYRAEKIMNIVVISKRDDDYCYQETYRRKIKYDDNSQV